MSGYKSMLRFRFRSLEMPYTTYKLKNLASFFKGKGYSKNDLVSSGYPIILYGRMYTDYKLNIKNITDTFVKDDIESFKSKQGDVIIPASGETAKDISIASNIEAKGIIIGGDLNVIRPNRTMINSTYLALNLSNGKLKKELVKKAQGKSIVHIHNTDLMDLYISLPSIPEQQKIGNLFAKLDRLLDLQQQKLDQLELLKKALLQKLFPKQDAKIPELRFKGFVEEWGDFVLGKIAKFLNGRAYKQSELLEKGKYPVLRVGNFYTNDSWYYSNLQLPEKYYAKKGDLLYTWSATFGPHIWNGSTVIYHYHIWKIELSSLLNKEFTYQLLLEDRSKLLNNTNGSTMIHLTKSEMESKLVKIPNIAEQQKIGNLLAKVDRLIELENKKFSNLKLVKKILLQNMFVE